METGAPSLDVAPQVLCPSAQPDIEGAQAFAVICGTPDQPRVAYLDSPQPATAELLAMAAPVAATEVFRFTTPCGANGCLHFDQSQDTCRLAKKAIRVLPAAVHKLSHCAIRTHCRWWRQEGPEGCRRCAQVVTTNYVPTAELNQLGDPEAP